MTTGRCPCGFYSPQACRMARRSPGVCLAAQHLNEAGAAAIPAPASSVPPPPPPPSGAAPTRVDAGAADRLRPLVRDAIAAAIAGCGHPDAGAPIYEPVRACPDCSAAAVVALFRGPVLRVDFVE